MKVGRLGHGTFLVDEKLGCLRIDKEGAIQQVDKVPGFTLPLLPISAVLGLWSYQNRHYLIVATKSEYIGHIQQQGIRKVTKTRIFPCHDNYATDKTISMLQIVLEMPYFYYSEHASFNLPNTRRKVLEEKCDTQYNWNQFLSKPFHRAHCAHWTKDIIFGFIGLKNNCNINGKIFDYAIISRRSIRNVGTRLWSRGVDSQGNPANTVETEQIIIYNDETITFEQIRGSIPFQWQQIPDLSVKPKVNFLHANELDDGSFMKHMYSLQERYRKFIVLSLVKQKGSEASLHKAYKNATSANNIPFIGFDFHAHCGKNNFSSLSILKEQIDPFIKEFGESRILGSTLASTQLGIIRTNCFDNLDRTNIVQTVLASYSAIATLQRLAILESDSEDALFIDFLKNMWADNADVIGIQYTGTGALNTVFTRTGKSNRMSQLKDKWISLTRYYLNNFHDGKKQDAYQMFLGNQLLLRLYEQKDKGTQDSSVLLYAVIFLIWLLLLFSFLLLKESVWVYLLAFLFLLCFSFLWKQRTSIIQKPTLMFQ